MISSLLRLLGCHRPGRLVFVLAVLPGLSALPGTLSAQSAPTPAAGSDPLKLERLVVTGSNIQRLDMEKVAPMTVLDETAIDVRGALVPVDLLTSLPSVVNLPENETRLGSSGARGDNANLNLRNLGATATLILVNGRRMAINPMTAGLSQAVNVNQLPTHGIERVEVLREGASAIYGSDAVGGVINYVLKREFSGVESTVRFGLPEAGGGESVQGSLTLGTAFAHGRGRLFATVEMLYRDAIFLSERAFSVSADSSARAEPPFNAVGGPSMRAQRAATGRPSWSALGRRTIISGRSMAPRR